MMTLRGARPGAGLLLAMLMLAGCSSAGAAQGQQAAAATTPPSAPPADPVRIPDAFLGTWTAEVVGGPASSGTWSLRITADDMELLNPIAKSEDEYFSLNPHTASETGVSLYADQDCEAAEYQWSIDGGSLAFEAVEDTCGDRRSVLTTTSWSRSP